MFPPEDIGIPCQQEEFNLNKKTAAAADIMDLAEFKEKIGQYCQLWELYAEASYELTRKSKLL